MIQENLKKIRTKLGLSQQDFADKLKVNVNTYRGYEYNKREMPYETLKFLIDTFNVNINWLLTGKGEMFTNITANKSDTSKDRVSQNVGQRILEIQKENNLKDKDMAKILEIYEYEYLELKHGQKEPTLRILDFLKKSFDISIDWVLYGE